MIKSLLAMVALLAASFAMPAPSAAQETAPYEINAVLSLSGGAAVIGQREAKMFAIAETVINKAGGVRNRPVKFIIQDDASSVANSVQLMSGLVAKGVPIVIGSSVAALCNAMDPLAEKNGPLVYCLSPIVNVTPGAFMFGTSAGTKDIIRYYLRLLKSQHLSKIALLTATDASGQTFEKEFVAGMAGPEGAGLDLVDKQNFNNSDISVAAQVAHIKAAAPQALVTYAVGPPFGTLLRALSDAGVTVPVFGSGGNLSYAQLEGYKGFAPKEMYLMGSNGLTPDPRAPAALRIAQNQFFQAYKDAGVRPEYIETVAWDPVMLLVDAVRKLGTDVNARQLRDYVANLRGWTGLDGVYDFHTVPQRGLGAEAVRAYQWIPQSSEIRAVPPLKVP